MVINLNTFFKKGLMLYFSMMSFFAFGQHQEEAQIKKVFDQLVLSYGNAKTAPELVFLKKKTIPIPPANYNPLGKPKIEVDLYLYTICRTYGKDSLNALSIVLSHELAHYYNDHKFCSDYAYAQLQSKDLNLIKSIKAASLNSRMEKETEADIKGFFYATAAGFSPFELQGDLINKIYKAYHLLDVQKGYPTKQQRKDIAKSADEKAKELYGYFQEGLKAMEEKRYDDAILAFDKANSFIPYRENFNNMGVARTLKALQYKVITSEEIHHPERFLYPLEIENKSRLNKEITRSLDDNSEEMDKLMKEAQKDFQEAIRLDPAFTKGYINLACVYDLLGNYPNAIGTILQLDKKNQSLIEVKRILAIAYFHDKQENKANAIWNELKI